MYHLQQDLDYCHWIVAHVEEEWDHRSHKRGCLNLKPFELVEVVMTVTWRPVKVLMKVSVVTGCIMIMTLVYGGSWCDIFGI